MHPCSAAGVPTRHTHKYSESREVAGCGFVSATCAQKFCPGSRAVLQLTQSARFTHMYAHVYVHVTCACASAKREVDFYSA